MDNFLIKDNVVIQQVRNINVVPVLQCISLYIQFWQSIVPEIGNGQCRISMGRYIEANMGLLLSDT